MASTITKFSHLQIPLEDVVKATKNFADENIISRGGPGGFGNAYKGRLLRSGELMDISARRLDRRYGLGDVEFWTEISMLSDLKHKNLLSIIGFCDEKDEKIIISTYEYSNGSLGTHLDDPKLTWMQRLTICVGVARALNYLHYDVGRSYGVIHRNISSDTILLDENWEAQLSGFEISLKQSVNRMDQVYLSHAIGTIGYMDPAIKNTGGVTHKSDIYSFGVVLFEILCGRKAFIQNDANRYLAPLAIRSYENKTLQDIIHPDLWEQMEPQSCRIVSQAAYSCLRKERVHRPNMDEVVDQLVKALELQLQQLMDLEHLQLAVRKKNLEHMKIPLSDIKLATNEFSETYRIASCTSYKLYRAELDHYDKENPYIVEGKNKGKIFRRHNTVVIKRILPREDKEGEIEFFTEIEMLTTCKHPNIVTLLGFCDEDSEMILVIDDLSNGYLGDYLEKITDMPILNWAKRLKICLDVAQALNYLHSEMEDLKMIIHRDIMSDSIQLDDNWRAKITNFEFSIFLPRNQDDNALHVNSICGRKGYIDPEYEKTYKLKRESDVYSLGVVLFEIFCGKRTNDRSYLKDGDEGLADVVRRCFKKGTLKKLIDPIINEETGENSFCLNRGPNKDSLDTFLKIAYQCVAETQDQRPTMKVVINELEKALNFQENHKNYLRISLEDVIFATKNFDNCNCIGQGGFGKVFIGKVPKGDGYDTIVAKRLDTSRGQGEQQFFSELQILNEYKHENIIRLLGYCDERDDKIIVYEYASRGSLDRYLNDSSLTWIKRLNICVDVATALDFLHGGSGTQAKVIHRDIKTANILIDDDWKAKLADFGLSLVSPINQETDYVIDHACGTPGYLDPLYKKSGFLTIESDIYSFGMLLFEILCGRSTFKVYKNEGQFLPSYIKRMFEEGKQDEVVFEGIKEQIMPKSLTTFQRIACQCLEGDRENRPTAKEVLLQLKMALLFQEKILKHLKKIPLSDIKFATDNFSNKYLTWSSEFFILYEAELDVFDKENPGAVEVKNKGELPKRHATVAIKRILPQYKLGEKAFLRNIEMLTTCKHCNIVTLLGYCAEASEMILVIEHASNGYLGDLLININGMSILSWAARLKICLDVANGINYLHCGMKDQMMIINLDIRSDYIALDKNWRAKIAEFGLSVFLPPDQDDDTLHLNEKMGTLWYKDPEYAKTGKLKRESDVYSFGVVLFEILCGRRANDPIYHKESGKGLAHLARECFREGKLNEIIDPRIKDETVEYNFILNRGTNRDSLETFSNIAYLCLAETQGLRPTMKVVIKALEKALTFQEKNLEHLKKIPLSDIKFATDNFSNKHRIWHSTYIIQYKAELDLFDTENPGVVDVKNKGELPERCTTVCIRRILPEYKRREMCFMRNIEMLTTWKHRNIVTLLGYCAEASEMILVFEHASNGCLGDFLKNYKDMSILSWATRLKICLDVANGIDYLHCGMEDQKMMINRGIKSSFIALDKDWRAKIADFGFSIFLPPNQVDDALYPDDRIGTLWYKDPEYIKTGKLKRESDVYSFGVVLFEILCGRSADDPIYRKESGKGLPHMARECFREAKLNEIIDPRIKDITGENNFILNRYSLEIFSNIAYQCLALTQDLRPTMKVVIKELEKALTFQEKSLEHLKKIPLSDIKFATDNFSNKHCIWRSSYIIQYKAELDLFDTENPGVVDVKNKGELPERCTTVCIKRILPGYALGEKSFMRNIEMLTTCKHHNIVTLLGYCAEASEMILVLEHASNGCLGDFLKNNDMSILSWAMRLKICLDVANGIDYLHCGMEDQKMIINRDIRSGFIALDKDWRAKIADLGFSIFLPPNQVDDALYPDERIGTLWYEDPEYMKTGKLKRESDVYSFGVVLFEMLCGRSAEDPIYHKESGKGLPQMARECFREGKLNEVIDPRIKDITSENNFVLNRYSLETFSNIAYQCLALTHDLRPTMKVVIKELEKALTFQTSEEHRLQENDLGVSDVGEGKVVETMTESSSLSQSNITMEKNDSTNSSGIVTSMLVEEFSVASCMSTLEATPDVSTRSYNKAMEHFLDLNRRTMFLMMSEHRRKKWLDTLDE